jgi:hypothetical protein
MPARFPTHRDPMTRRHFHVFEQPELFSDLVHRALGAPPRPNAHGVYMEPDETLELLAPRKLYTQSGRVTVPMAISRIELLYLPCSGWIGAYSYRLSQGAMSGPLVKHRPMASGDTRQACLDDARAKLARAVAAYCAHHGKPTTETRRVLRWLAAGCQDVTVTCGTKAPA